MNLRNKNFVGQIFDISVIKATIEGLLGGDKYYFYVNIKGQNRVFYIDVYEYQDGVEFKFYRDLTKFTYTNIPGGEFGDSIVIEDELIKVYKSTSEGTVVDSKVVSYSQTPEKDMAEYVVVYIDAMQTI